MARLGILNSRDMKALSRISEKQWGCGMPSGYAYMKSEKGRIYMVSRDFGILNDARIRIDSVGLYLGTLNDGTLRLSIEGSQLLGKEARSNVLDLHDEEAGLWMRGEPIEKSCPDGPLIMRHGDDFLGCGIAKKGKIANFIPKERRDRS